MEARYKEIVLTLILTYWLGDGFRVLGRFIKHVKGENMSKKIWSRDLREALKKRNLPM